jgi:hypothetical protein
MLPTVSIKNLSLGFSIILVEVLLIYSTAEAQLPVYPLKISDNSRYLVDQNDKPFFMSGEAGWSLIAQVSKEDAILYLDDRNEKGFNVIMVNLIEHAFCNNAPRNYYGEHPFTGTTFVTPNEDYFEHADYVINEAAQRGMVVMLFPLYLGYGCGSQGWCNEVSSASLSDMYTWGQYVGTRYENYDNIIWAIGADTDPSPVKAKVLEFVRGMTDYDTRHLITAHNQPGSEAISPWENESWLTINNVYSYSTSLYVQCYSAYTVNPVMPYFMLESVYENEHGASQQQLRSQAYWPVLSGGMGHIFGNCPIWHFGSDGMYVQQLFTSLDWHLLVPDFDHVVMTAGYGNWGNRNYVTAALTEDGNTMVAYLPSSRPVTIDMSKISGFEANCKWYNPSNGSNTEIGTYATSGNQNFTPPSNGDWLLVIDGVPLFAATELLGRPTDNSVTLNLVPNTNMQSYIEYGVVSGNYSDQTNIVSGLATEPLEILINSLQMNTRYYYRVLYSIDQGLTWISRQEHTFHTQRSPNSTFSFLIQTDPHVVEDNVNNNFGNPTIYEITLQNEANEQADFIIDLGNTFLSDQAETESQSNLMHLGVRKYFDQVAHSTPLLLALGNHDGECGWLRSNAPDNVAVWATNSRKKYYPNPIPDGFYTGSTTVTPNISGDGLRENYYAWHWGDALFVVLDPYWFSIGGLASGEWNWSLGEDQYNWFKSTLEQSSAAYKFVFAHQLFSIAAEGRGGANRANTGEWGAVESDFITNRPGWTYHQSIHDIMVTNNVTTFFHGHDKFYGVENLDGIVYQECPMPSSTNSGSRSEYPNAYSLDSGGYLKVTVSPLNTQTDYTSSTVPGSIGENIDSYIVTNDQTLPVSLSNFSGKSHKGEVLLEWRTESEINNNGFELYKSETEKENYVLLSSFRENQELEGLGNSSNGKDYSYKDRDVVSGKSYWYKIADVDYKGNKNYYDPISVYVEDNELLPEGYFVYQNYPNPFNPFTNIKFTIPKSDIVTLRVYDLLGIEVNTLVKRKLEAGIHIYNFDASNLASGVYLYRIEAGNFHSVKRMTYVK